MILGQTFLPKLALPSGYFHLDFLTGTSVLICRILKAPAPWGGLICFYYCMLSHLVSYLLSHPWHLSSITRKSCCVAILLLESGLAFAQRCYQPRTSAPLPLWQPTLAPGNWQESGPCGRRIWLYSSVKSTRWFIPKVQSEAFKMARKAHPSTGFCLLQLPLGFLDLNCLCFLTHARQLSSLEPVLYAVSSAPWYSVPWPSPPWTWLLPFTLLIFKPSWESPCTQCEHRVWHTVGISIWFWKEGRRDL